MNVDLNRSRVLMFVALGGLLAAAGCGGAYDSTASGVVTLNGSTVPGGSLVFHPGSGGPIPYATIDQGGSYVVRTGREEGLPPGDYQVTVSAYEPPATLLGKDGGPAPAGKAITPLWYQSTETSGLSYTVESGNNEINIDLTTEPPAGWNPRGRR
jgi:hypothetical protein